MDPVKIIKRAWNIVWNYRVLWIFGFILALTASGSSGGSGNSGSRYTVDGSEEYQMPSNMEQTFNNAGEAFEAFFTEANIPQGEISTLIWIGGAFVLVMIVISILMTIARYVSENSVIRMVDEYEASGTKMTFREGWRLGWSRTAWRFFLIDLFVHLPVFILLAFFAVMGVVIYKMVSVSGLNSATWASMAGIIAVVLVVLFVFALVMVFLRLLRQFFWRAAAFENLGVRDSLRAGFQLFRENWKDIGIMWLVMVGLGIAWAIASIIAMVVSLPVIAITVVAGAVVASIPGLLMVGFFSLFLSGYLPWVAGGLFVLPLFFIVGFSPWVMLQGWVQTYTSTVWTLVYRELKALPELAVEPETEVTQLEE
ncbi:MAG: hypothetical protein HN855_13010 [Anaerolineae bacterium]|jgi:hypothetical protein|nr:hypothetical protein [Anaerolineae bacterium]MBT7073215.1 hypothetical protein [Anaerolineae bacterium]MBT7326074.1 hypothetical protein [Anaerolineae bacterium]